jgi:hypothetical protein
MRCVAPDLCELKQQTSPSANHRPALKFGSGHPASWRRPSNLASSASVLEGPETPALSISDTHGSRLAAEPQGPSRNASGPVCVDKLDSRTGELALRRDSRVGWFGRRSSKRARVLSRRRGGFVGATPLSALQPCDTSRHGCRIRLDSSLM